ncbi:MAG: CBS domain-containing protein [Gemmatimonadota bacterium]
MTLVKEIMQKDVVTISPGAPVSEPIQKLGTSKITGLPVVDAKGILVGVISSQDIMRLAGDLGQVPEAVRWGLQVAGPFRDRAVVDSSIEGEFFAYYVTPRGGFVDLRDRIRELPGDVFEGYSDEDIMTRDPVTVDADATLRELARLLGEKNIRRALVLQAGKLVGIVTVTDILSALARG